MREREEERKRVLGEGPDGGENERFSAAEGGFFGGSRNEELGAG